MTLQVGLVLVVCGRDLFLLVSAIATVPTVSTAVIEANSALAQRGASDAIARPVAVEPAAVPEATMVTSDIFLKIIYSSTNVAADRSGY